MNWLTDKGKKQGLEAKKNGFNKNGRVNLAVVLLIVIWLSICANAQQKAAEIFSFNELETLYKQENLPRPLADKLNNLLTTPFVDNSYENTAANLPRSEKLGEFLRVAEWNIERGVEFEAVAAALGSEENFDSMINGEKFPPGSKARARLMEEAAALREADVIVLNEVDFGMKRSGYRRVAAELAAKLRMNYAFGVEFVELTPVYFSLKEPPADTDQKQITDLIKVDPTLYKGLTGTAILSRFPLENVRLAPFKTKAYDWYQSEKKGMSLLERGKETLTNKVFLEETLREIRRGGRNMLLADIADARFPGGRVTIAATHLENRTKASNRLKEMNELLARIKNIDHPVVVAGDLNTSSSDLTPTSIRREILKRYGDPKFWVKQGINYALGIGIFEDFVTTGFSFGRKYADPTVKNIPFFSPNSEHKLFSTVEKFRFADGGAFDFRGEETRSANGKDGNLANSNERADKGFRTTFQVTRPILIFGRYKLDWFFVKPSNLKDPKNEQASHRFAPHFGRTLDDLNKIIKDCISDHCPIIVDLPINEPPSAEK